MDVSVSIVFPQNWALQYNMISSVIVFMNDTPANLDFIQQIRLVVRGEWIINEITWKQLSLNNVQFEYATLIETSS